MFGQICWSLALGFVSSGFGGDDIFVWVVGLGWGP